ncbi:DUF1611 domain-containing protein [Natrialbaceae archaeon AArc-T1-2]|uniref:DUF1611 domain-containing protein n=1 Tax=Natrialbaceae archaeon AArc-T1-2 TaxID=3053904 RepID=UPI00255B1300|nr:DUF1611 domain-containing protein [Natrialbaceae archaeon AArc-T1-2]WIV68501.1 DUF1611 domain-containing protein [Natrialbaceae archaeon AArc-T1-2]
MRVAILAHEQFPDRAKTALGVLRYADYDVAAVLDRETAGRRVTEFVADVQDAPIVSSMDDVDDPVDALLIGIAPIGGGFEEHWRPDVRTALERSCDVISGLHYFLAEDEEFATLADEHGCELRDVREPPADLTVADGVADEVDADVILTVGTDCSVGKMTTTMELSRDANEHGYDAAVVPTGQTGIMIEGWGNPIDRVISDFTAGAVEEMILEVGDDHDYLFVEGQGSIVHPAYSAVTCGILHGAMADKLVLCHEAGRETVHGYESFSLPPIRRYVDLYEGLAEPVRPARIFAGALNTRGLEDDAAAREAVDAYAEALGAPATDAVRFDTDGVLDALL